MSYVRLAGAGAIGDFEQLNMGAIEASMNVNLLAPLRFEGDPPHLRRKGSGDVFVLGSEASLRGAKRGSIYAGAKFALRGSCRACALSTRGSASEW